MKQAQQLADEDCFGVTFNVGSGKEVKPMENKGGIHGPDRL